MRGGDSARILEAGCGPRILARLLFVRSRPPDVGLRSLNVKSRAPNIKSAPLEVKTAPLEVESAPLEVESAPLEVKTAPLEIKTAPLEVKTAPPAVESAPLEVKSAPTRGFFILSVKSGPIFGVRRLLSRAKIAFQAAFEQDPQQRAQRQRARQKWEAERSRLAHAPVIVGRK